MVIHLIAPKDQTKWLEIWNHCYNIWKSSPYKIKMWHDEDIDQLLKEDDEEFFNTLNTLPTIYKFDYVRYIILEKFGGAYFDMDVEIVTDFLCMLNPNKIYIAEGDIGELYQNNIMISPISLSNIYSPTKEVWETIKLFCKQNILNNKELCQDKYNVMKIVGPFALSEWFSKYFNDFNLPKVGVLSKHHFGKIDSDICFAKHHQTSNWNK